MGLGPRVAMGEFRFRAWGLVGALWFDSGLGFRV